MDYWHLNAADYGVPQTRRRLILVARLNGKPIKPLATHARPDKLTPMLDTRLPWIGWYAAIEDLIDTLPPSQFAPWQLERLPQEMIGAFTSDMQNIGRDLSTRDTSEPFTTITATMFRRPIAEPKAFIVNGTPNDYGASVTACGQDDPVFTQTSSMDKRPSRAWISCGRVVKMTPRALARFQSFQDWYAMPDKAKLACTVIGNAVPPLLYQRVIEAQIAKP